MKKYIAELFGTFTLASIVLLSLESNAIIATPLAAGLVLMLFVYTIGSISGTHINPAVTLGLMSIKKIAPKEGLMYIIYQSIGAALAFILLNSFLGLTSTLEASSDMQVFVGEFMGMLLFTFGIAAVVYGKVTDSFSGVVVGGSLLLGILCAAYIGSNGVLNPAVAFTINSLSLTYLFGQILGSVAGFNLYKYLISQR